MNEEDLAPLRVHVVNAGDMRPVTKLRKILVSVFRTVLLPTAKYIDLAPYDPSRLYLILYGGDADLVICHDLSQAQDPINQVANVPNPNGLYIKTGANMPVKIPGVNRMWVAGPVANTRIGVVEVHETSE